MAEPQANVTDPQANVNPPLLRSNLLTRRFGGLTAVNGVSLAFEVGLGAVFAGKESSGEAVIGQGDDAMVPAYREETALEFAALYEIVFVLHDRERGAARVPGRLDAGDEAFGRIVRGAQLADPARLQQFIEPGGDLVQRRFRIGAVAVMNLKTRGNTA